jgi:hypothetical protein
MKSQLFGFLALSLVTVACGAREEKTSTPFQTLRPVLAVSEQSALTLIEAATLQNMSLNLILSLEQNLDEALSQKFSGFVRFKSEKNSHEIKKIGLKTNGETTPQLVVTVELSLREALILAKNLDIAVVEVSQILRPLGAGSENPITTGSSSRAAGGNGVIQATVNSVDLLKTIEYRSLSPKLISFLDNSVKKALEARGSGFVRFTSPKSNAEISALGIQTSSTASGLITTAQFSLSDALRLSTLPDVSLIEGAKFLRPLPSISVR